MFLPRRMLGRNVERGEIVEVFLDMRPLGDHEAHLAKDRDDLVDGLADRVDLPGIGAARGPRQHRQGHIGAFAGKPAGQRGAAQPVGGFLERGGNLIPEPVQPGAGFAALVRRELAEFAHQQGDRAIPAEQLDPDLLQRLGRLRAGNLLQELI